MKNGVKKSIYKISLCAIFVAITVILSRLAIYLPFFGSNSYRISLIAIPIIISSFLLGPIYGGIVGGLGDLIGALLFPVGPFFIGFTFDSFLLGLLPGLIFYLNKISKKITATIFIIMSMAVIGVVTAYLVLNDSITLNKTKFELNIWVKIFIPIVYAALFLFSLLFPLFFKKKSGNFLVVSTSFIVNEFIVSGLIASLWKQQLYNIDYFIGISTNLFLLLFNMPIKVLLITTLYPLIKTLFDSVTKNYIVSLDSQINIKR